MPGQFMQDKLKGFHEPTMFVSHTILTGISLLVEARSSGKSFALPRYLECALSEFFQTLKLGLFQKNILSEFVY